MREDEAYEKIDKEITSGELVRSVWTRAYADADGDESKAKARYIKERFSQIMRNENLNNKSENYEPKLKFIIYPHTLNNSNKQEIVKLSDAAEAEFQKYDNTLAYSLAGLGLSKGGAEKIENIQKAALEKLIFSVEKIPENLNREANHQLFVDLSSACNYYLFLDKFRDRTPGFSFGKQRDIGKQRDELMDRISFSATIYLKLAEDWLNFGRQTS